MVDRAICALALTAILAFPAAAQKSGADSSKQDGNKDFGEPYEFVIPNLDVDALRFVMPPDLAWSPFVVEADGMSGYLGVVLDALPDARAKELGIDKGSGVIIRSVIADSPASRASLREGDVIVAIDGRPMTTPDEVRAFLRDGQQGQSVRIEVLRDKKRQTVTAILETRKQQTILRRGFGGKAFPGDLYMAMAHRPRLGVAVVELTEQLREYFGVETGKGVLVSSVEAGSAAAKAGIRAGDVLVSIGTTEVASVRDLIGELRKHPTGTTTLDVGIVRDRNRQTLSVTIDVPEERAQPGVGHYRT